MGTALAPARETRAEQRRRLPSPVGDGRYQFERLIGEGRHKRVYLAIDRHAGREVGLALIKAQAFDDLGEARVWREFDAIARVSGHTNTVAFYDSGEDSYGRPYLVTEHAAGGDLSGRIAQAQDHPIALGEVLRIAADVASALDHVHSCGIVHRDVKPENLWLTADGDIKLGDFGLSLAGGERQPGAGQSIEGTAAYIAPEQALGAPADERSDLARGDALRAPVRAAAVRVRRARRDPDGAPVQPAGGAVGTAPGCPARARRARAVAAG